MDLDPITTHGVGTNIFQLVPTGIVSVSEDQFLRHWQVNLYPILEIGTVATLPITKVEEEISVDFYPTQVIFADNFHVHS